MACMRAIMESRDVSVESADEEDRAALAASFRAGKIWFRSR